MKIIKKGLALLLTAALVITMVPAASVFAAGGSSAAGGDAFSAIGIDTSVAPDGYDADSIDNPYGRSTIKVNTVSELYTVGLSRTSAKLTKRRKMLANQMTAQKGKFLR